MDTLDYILLNRPTTHDDQCMAFERVVSDVSSPVICFLPWRVQMPLAKSFGLLPDRFLACYELPSALVGSVPKRCVDALMMLVGDALALLNRHKVEDPIIIGLSAGSAPATILAELTRGRLYSVTSADRGDLMLWESAATATIKSRAIAKGYELNDFRDQFEGLNPIDNLKSIRKDSIFVVSTEDPFIPRVRSEALIEQVRRHVPTAPIVKSHRGHVRTLRSAVRQLPNLLLPTRESRNASLHSVELSGYVAN